ncbi:MAG TPA: hybrid sensor histidine kinase/response regulator, partial [Candidatus Latescibacteria bacterium]|nr:hybrid sensor histidine kinase/response regulator [Candidatus Latescibacterota bacterium]
MTDYDDHILQAFIEESQEHLDGIENDLLRIEAAGAEIDDDLVNEVFRAVHSIKGGSSFLGLENITELAHAMESVLNMVRNRQLVLDGTGTSVLL